MSKIVRRFPDPVHRSLLPSLEVLATSIKILPNNLQFRFQIWKIYLNDIPKDPEV